MSRADLTASIEAEINGSVSGQVAVGSHILQIGSVHGGVVNVAVPGQAPVPRARPLPVLLRPRPFPGLVGRAEEVESAVAALRSARPVQLSGEPGAGKTALLRHLAYHPAAASFPAGVAYLSALRQPADDLLHSLFEAFYQADAPLKPSFTELCHLLQGVQALVVLDDVELGREEVERIQNAAPGCTFLWSAPERQGWGEVRALPLPGLAPEEARTLVEQALERPLAADEQAGLDELCRATGGYPLPLLQAAARVREDGVPLREVVAQLRAASSPGEAGVDTVAKLPEAGRNLMVLLAALGGALLHPRHAAAIAGVPAAGEELERLERCGLAQRQGERYRVLEPLAAATLRAWDAAPWRERALAYFVSWTEQQWNAPGAIVEESDVLMLLLAQAVDAGAWPEVLRLGRRVEGALALAGRWDAWKQVVEWLRLAAEAREDRRGAAWALHQLGTLALCAGNRAAAQGALTQALRLRESAGDREGARVTRHNLDLLLGVPSGPGDRGGERWRGALRAARKPVVAAAVVAVVGAVGVVSLVSRETAPPVPRVDSAPLAQDFREAPVDSAPRADSAAVDTAVADTAAADTAESPRPAPPPPARVRADRTAVDFGSHPVGAPGGERRVGVTNEGGSSTRIAGVRLEGGARDFRLAGSGCEGAVLAPGEGCSVSVRFTPAASGRRTATLVLEPGAQGSRLRVGLRGEGEETPPPRRVAGVVVSPAGGVDFGEHEVGAPPRVLRVTLASRGTAPLALRGLSVEGAAARDFTVDAPCVGAEVAPGVACSVAVRFSPTAPGRRTAELLVRSNDPAGPQRVPLGGTGAARVVAAPADAQLSAASLELGERPVGAVGDLGGFVDALVNGARILTIRSTGQAPLQVSAVRIEGADAGDFSVGSRPCRSPVPPKRSCSFRVNFNPGATGSRRAVLVIEDNTAASPRRVGLSGVGVEPRDRAAPPTPQPRGIGSPDVNQATTQCQAPLHLAWSPVSDPSAPVTYRVTFQVGPTGGTPGEHFLDTTDTSRTVPALGPGQSLRWSVRARDAAGNEGRPSRWLHVVCPPVSVIR